MNACHNDVLSPVYILYRTEFVGYWVFFVDIFVAPSMSKISCVNSNIDEYGDTLRNEFESYLSSLFVAISDKREQEELSIMQS